MSLFRGLKAIISPDHKVRRGIPGPVKDVRVLHIGGYWRGRNDMVWNMMMGLRAAGAQVRELNTGSVPGMLDTGGRPYDYGSHGPVWIREQFLEKTLDEFDPHVIVCNAGGLSFRPDYSEALRRRLYLLGITLSDPDVFQPATRHIASTFDLFLTNDKSLLPEYRKAGANAAVLPMGTNENFFRPLPPLPEHKTDVLIIGRALPNRAEPVRAIVGNFETRVYGEGWETYGISTRGTIYGDEALHALNSAGIAPVFLHNPDGTAMYVKAAVLDFPAAGGLVITDYLPDVEDYLTFGKEIIGFGSTTELLEKIEYFLRHPDEAGLIRRAGHLKVTRDHSWSRVWPRILAMLGRLP